MTTLKQAIKQAKKTRKRIQVTKPSEFIETKISTSIRLDEAVLKWLKSESEKLGIPYTTLANAILKKESMKDSLESRVERLEKALSSKAV